MHPKFEERRTRLAAERQFSVQNDLTHTVVGRVVESAKTLRALIGQGLAEWNPRLSDDDVTSASLDFALWIERVDEAYAENRPLFDVFEESAPEGKSLTLQGYTELSPNNDWEFYHRPTEHHVWGGFFALMRVACPVSSGNYYMTVGGFIWVRNGDHGPEAEAYCYE